MQALKELDIEASKTEKTSLPFEIVSGIEFKNQAQFNPIKYIDGLVKRITDTKGKIFENTICGVYFAKMYQTSSYVIGIDTKSELFDGMYINIQSPIYSFRTAKDGNKKSLLLFMMCLFYYFTTFKNKLIEII